MSARAFCKAGIALGLCNYALYALVTSIAGGDALLGHVAHGHYLVQIDGRFVEISRMLFLAIRWGAYGLLATFPLGLVCASFLSPEPRGEEESLTAAWPQNGS